MPRANVRDRVRGLLRPAAPLLLLAGCGGEEPERAGPAGRSAVAEVIALDARRETPVAPADAAPPADGAAEALLFEARMPPLNPTQEAEALRRDPAVDGWTSEVWAERARAALQGLIEDVLASADPAARLAPGFAGAAGRVPRELETVLDADGATVRRAATDAEQPDAAAFAAVLERVRAAAPGRVEVIVVGVDPAAGARGGAFRTRCLLQVVREAPGPRLQIDAELEADWSEEQPPRLAALSVARWEEVRLAAPLFVEATGHAFAGVDGWEEELLRGVGDFHMRIDQLAGFGFQGMQGIAVGDVNGDGLDDVLVGQQVGLPNRLLVREPDGTVVDRAPDARLDFLDVTRAALILDFDNDGHQDVALAVGSFVVVAYNDGQGAFPRQMVLPLPGQEQIYTLSAADPDGDGDLDLFAGRYVLGGVMHGFPTPYHDANNGATNGFWRNEGNRRFSDATQESGLAVNNHKFTLASIWEDFDHDGDLDLYVVNDFGRNQLFQNDGAARFVDVAERAGAIDQAAGMGATCGDYDLDGDVDLYVTNMFAPSGLRVAAQSERFMDGRHPEIHRHYVRHARGNTLLANAGDGTFEDVTEAAGVALGRWGWGGKFVDFQNDGWEDLYVPNGSTTSRSDPGDLEGFFWRRVIAQSPADTRPTEAYKSAFTTIHALVMYRGATWNGRERNCAYLNLRDGRFASVSGASGADFPDDARAAAVVDWDDDGLADLLLKNRNGPRLRLLLSRPAERGHFLAFDLVGTTSNRDAIGARVVVEAGGRVLRKRIYGGDGYLSQSSKRVLVGLGDATGAERVRVEWPGGEVEDFGALEGDARWRLVQGSGRAERVEPRAPIAFADAGPSVPEPNETRASRVVLANKLALGPFGLPAFDDPGRAVAALAGAPALVAFWSSRHAGSRALLDAAAAARDELAEIGLAFVPLTVDEGRDLAAARRDAREAGHEALAGYADGRTRQAFEAIFLEVLGFYDDVPLPTALLLDRAGQLAVIYIGEVDLERVLADARVLQAADPANPLTLELSGGRWRFPRRRDTTRLRETLGMIGRGDLARSFYEDETQR